MFQDIKYQDVFQYGDPFDHKYKQLYKIGKGYHADAFLCVKKSSQEIYVCKVIDKSRSVVQQDLKIEVKNQVQVHEHIYVCTLVESWEFEDKMYIVLEPCFGDDFIQLLKKRHNLYEDEAAFLTFQILEGVHHMHKNNLIHRDLKPENIMFLEKKDDLFDQQIRIIDFGLSIDLGNKKEIRESMVKGSVYYLSPEVLQGIYSFSVDMWSVGILVCLLVYGRLPFTGKNNTQIFQSILFQDPDFEAMDDGRHLDVSTEAINFIQGLLEKNPQKRFTAQQALKHPFLNGMDASTSSSFSSDNLFEKVQSFKDLQRKKYLSIGSITSNNSSFTSSNLNNSFNSSSNFNKRSSQNLQGFFMDQQSKQMSQQQAVKNSQAVQLEGQGIQQNLQNDTKYGSDMQVGTPQGNIKQETSCQTYENKQCQIKQQDEEVVHNKVQQQQQQQYKECKQLEKQQYSQQLIQEQKMQQEQQHQRQHKQHEDQQHQQQQQQQQQQRQQQLQEQQQQEQVQLQQAQMEVQQRQEQQVQTEVLLQKQQYQMVNSRFMQFIQSSKAAQSIQNPKVLQVVKQQQQQQQHVQGLVQQQQYLKQSRQQNGQFHQSFKLHHQKLSDEYQSSADFLKGQKEQKEVLSSLFKQGSFDIQHMSNCLNQPPTSFQKPSNRRARNEIIRAAYKAKEVDYVSFPWGDYDIRNRSNNAIMDLKKLQSRKTDTKIYQTPYGHDRVVLKNRKNFDLDEYLKHYKELRYRNHLKKQQQEQAQAARDCRKCILQMTKERLLYNYTNLNYFIQVLQRVTQFESSMVCYQYIRNALQEVNMNVLDSDISDILNLFGVREIPQINVQEFLQELMDLKTTIQQDESSNLQVITGNKQVSLKAS